MTTGYIRHFQDGTQVMVGPLTFGRGRVYFCKNEDDVLDEW